MSPREILTNHSPLKGLSVNTLRELLWQASFVHKNRGERLYTEGESSDGRFHIVLEGELEILFPPPATPERRGPGAICGEIALVNQDGKRTATVKVASETAALLQWNGAELRADAELFKVLRGVAWPRMVEKDKRSGAGTLR
jgi:CRP-like cAMP-binding protein